MKIISDKKPCHFPIECFHGANKFHEEIGSKEFLILDKSNVFNSKNESYKTIDRKDHIFLNHLFKKKSKISNNVINSVAIKYRHKILPLYIINKIEEKNNVYKRMSK